MLTRRTLLKAGLASALLPGSMAAAADADAGDGISWRLFLDGMERLSSRQAAGQWSAARLGEEGLALLRSLNLADPGWLQAVSESVESGNRFWLWQRLTRQAGLLGGILHIEAESPVPLHDHPGATGMLRVITGSVEVWQFDPAVPAPAGERASEVELSRVAHRILQPGDTAVLHPEAGNIHGLRALTPTASMLDYFVPPYERSRRHWYVPMRDDWQAVERVRCKCHPESVFYLT